MRSRACMAGAVAALLLVIVTAGAARADEHVTVEIVPLRDAHHLQERVPLALRITYDVEFFRERAVQLFRRELDVPVQVEAPWLDDLPGAARAGPDPRDLRARVRIAVNDRVSQAVGAGTETRDGRTFGVLLVERAVLPTVAGETELTAPVCRYAHASTFREDLLRGRIPLDREDVEVRGAAARLRVVPLPEKGRPAGFAGAVGRFEVAAEIRPQEVAAGESLELVLRIIGLGNLELLDPPRLTDLAGFHVFGVIEREDVSRRTFVYDVAPLDGTVTEVPAIPFTFFDPAPPAGYHTVRTAAIPLVVRGAATPPAHSDTGTSPVPAETPVDPAPPGGVGAGTLILVVVGVVVALLLFRRRTARAEDPREQAAHAATEVLTARLADDPPDPGGALAAFLGAHLDCPEAAVVSPDLPRRLIAAGVPDALARRTSDLLEELVAARYGGAPPVDGVSARVRALADELAREFARSSLPGG